MLPVGQECKAGLCCYAGVRYKNTTRHFQSSNAGRAPAPPPRSRQTGSAAQGPAPGPRRWALQRLWWVSSHRRQPRQSAAGAAEGPLCPAPHGPRGRTAGDPLGGKRHGEGSCPTGARPVVGWRAADRQPCCQLPAISLLFLAPNQTSHHHRPALRRAQAPPQQGTMAPTAGTPGRAPGHPRSKPE